MLFFAIIASFVLAAILKLIALVLKIENRGYWQCYRTIFFSFCLLFPFLEYGNVSNQLVLFSVKFVIFVVALLLGLNASITKSSIAAVVLSLLFTISINEKSQESSNEHAFVPTILDVSKAYV